MMSYKNVLLVLTALTAPPALAQTAPTPAAGTDDEILVTAQKSSQRAQDIPLVVTAVSGAALERAGATRIQDIAASVPSLQVDSLYGVPGSHSLTLRGITTGTQASTTVATYVDDVPLGSSSAFASANLVAFDLFPYDLDHVEVLEGPQGTLYGASSMGGLVKYVTTTPSLTQNRYRFGGDLIGVDNGSELGWTARGAVNLVVVPSELAISISAVHQLYPGYVDNVATGVNDVNRGTQDGARVAVLWKPSSRFTLNVSGIFNRSDFDGLAILTVNANGTPLFGRYAASKNRPQGYTGNTKIGSVTAEYDLDGAKLTSITSYSDLHSNFMSDSSATFRPIFGVDAAFTNDISVEKFTQELRVASPTDQVFSWLVGAFYTNEKTRFQQVGLAYLPNTNTESPTFSPLLDGTIPSRYREWAVFANGTFKITDDWDVGAGVRYSRNDQSVTQTARGLLVGAPLNLAERTSSDDAITFSATTSYRFVPGVLGYVRVASGYRPGGPNFIVPGIAGTYEPDKLTNYEAGLKSDLFDRRLTLNLSAFYIDWRNVQLQGATATNLAYIANGGRAESRGFQAVANLKVADGLTFGGSVAYTDAKLRDNAPQVAGFAGDRLPLTPEWAGSLQADYAFRVDDRTRATFGASWRYTGPRHQMFPSSPRDHLLGAFNVLNINAGVSRGPVRLSAYVRNLTNEYAFTSWLSNNGPTVLQPRTFGLSLDFDFN